MKLKYLQLQIIVLSIKICKKCCCGEKLALYQMQRILLVRFNSYFPFIKNAIYTETKVDERPK